MIIKGLEFVRLPGDLWHSRDKTIWLALVLETPAYPWRFGINGHWFKGKFVSPAVALRRGRERIGYHGIVCKPCEMVAPSHS